MNKLNIILRRTVLVIFCVLLVVATLYRSASAQTTVFTYQGRLTDSAATATGTYDFQFVLYDQSNAVIGTIQHNGVSVSNGTFTVQLDFGVMFPGADRFLEIRVKCPADASYTALTPRQQITSAPYAIRSLNAAFADTAATATNSEQLGNVSAVSLCKRAAQHLFAIRQHRKPAASTLAVRVLRTSLMRRRSSTSAAVAC